MFIDKNRRLHSFELFGYDFMIDEDFKVYLIEVNINPCLSITSAFSSRFIPSLIDNTLKIVLDPMFPPPPEFANRKYSINVLPKIKYELIFDQKVDGPEIDTLYKNEGLSKKDRDRINELNAEIDEENEAIDENYLDEESID